MKLEAIKTESTEVFLEADQCSVSIHTWGNHEGINVMMFGKDLSLRMACALRWEEADLLAAALSAARAA